MKQPQVSPWLYRFLYPFHRLLLAFYFGKIEVKGREHLPESGPAVFAPKHHSRWDPVLMPLLSVEPLYYMTKADQFGGIQGVFIKQVGAFPVNLDKPSISTLRLTLNLLKAGKKLVMFPEGGIVRDRPLRSLKPGLARLVMQAEEDSAEDVKIPIIPVAIRYEPDAKWRARVFIQINPPLYVEEYRQEKDKKTALALTSALEDSLRSQLERN